MHAALTPVSRPPAAPGRRAGLALLDEHCREKLIGAMSTAARYDEVIMLPRAVRFPVEMEPPDGFDATRTETWPVVSGRLEYVEGRLIYMPPAGDLQQDTVSDVVITLGAWVRANPQFVLATNEAGMILNGSTRAADAAIWRRRDV